MTVRTWVFSVVDLVPIMEELIAMAVACQVWDENRTTFLVNRERVREIGEQLNTMGGMEAMLLVHEGVRAVLKESLEHEWAASTDARELEMAWSGIGEWQG